MKDFWNVIQLVFTAVGGWLGYFLGGCDGLLYALIAFVVIDYITGVMCAIAEKKLSSEVGFKGICRKVLIFLLVGIGNIIDVQVMGTPNRVKHQSLYSDLSSCRIAGILCEDTFNQSQIHHSPFSDLSCSCSSTVLMASGTGSPRCAAFSRRDTPSLDR